MVATLKTFQEAYAAFTDADEKYGAYVQAMPELPTKEQIADAEKLNDEVKEYEAQVLQFKKGEELRQQYQDRKATRNTAVDSIGFGTPGDTPGITPGGKSKLPGTYGDTFLSDPQVKNYLGNIVPPGGHLSSGVRLDTPHVTIPNMGVKALITGLSDTGAGAMVRTTYLDTVSMPLRPLTLKDLITIVPVNSDAIEYARLVTLTNAAAPTLEATTTAGAVGAKPESSMEWLKVNDTVKTIAHWFAVTNRALSDAPQLRAMINEFGFYGLEEELEDQIATGDGTGENFTGIATQTGFTPQAYSSNVLTTTRKAVTTARRAHARINGWLFSLDDWEAIDLLADNENRYYYGGPQVLGNPRLWGYPVVDSEPMPNGYAYVGDFRTIVLFDREDAQMFMSNSHSDFFIRNLVAVLFELRAGLGYLRPAAIVKADLTA